MKPETVIQIWNALSRQVGTETIRAVLGALITTPEYQALVKDAEIGLRYVELRQHGKHETGEQYDLCGCPDAWAELHALCDAAIDAARNG
ncbi:MAG: hypothetical protein E6Q97_29850 [Desulfurellales bacterium]|nr:MAG: hypothetical protein E6Q97_29850 [Desulfurellales bacterium]